MTKRRFRNALASSGVTCALMACSHRQQVGATRAEPAAPTPAEASAVGCYRLLNPVRGAPEEFILMDRHGRGAGPERFGLLIRPRGEYKSAYWRAVRSDTLELVWTSTPSDSAGPPGTVIFMNALRARVVLVGDTLMGNANWNSDVLDGPGTPTSWDVRATRVSCSR